MNMKERVIKVLDELNLDAVLVSDGYNMRYISGFTGATGYLYVSRNRSVILTDFRYTIQANNQSQGFEVIEIGKGGYTAAINDLLDADQTKRLGFEDDHLLYANYSSLNEKLHKEEMVPVKDALTKLRIVKTADELEKIKMAEHIGDIAFTKILEVIKPGMTELEVAAYLEFFMKTNGAEGLSFDSIVASGVNSSMPHATPSNKKIELGDFVTMDFGCLYQGYCSDMTRTIVVGKASPEQKEVYNTVLKAQLAAMEVIRAGVIGKDVDKVARDLIDSTKYKGCFGHGLGHSVGLFIHEEPRFSAGENNAILAGVTETVEPGIYIKDFGGVRIEDLVVVTENGFENFTHSEKQLIEL
ncbi:M24 family metallopeptidase [Anaerosporobacter faecicola]|uniref:M24 family metallopeptidase n=1 Tax=Anaerosporobacter faecicola TaxID=2718714 RepID=UPI001EE6268F|nr:aminopeptidase P family protein [Anaerosporobacter faecicola]